jgi:hypothetical protein
MSVNVNPFGEGRKPRQGVHKTGRKKQKSPA